MLKYIPDFEKIMAIGVIILGIVLVVGSPWLPEFEFNNFSKKSLIGIYFGVLLVAHGVILIKMREDERRLKELKEVVEEEIEKLKKQRD